MAEIVIVRGDTLKLTLNNILLSDGSEYVLSDSDIIYLDVKRYATDKTAIIRKSATKADYIDGGTGALEGEQSAIKMKVDQLYFYDNYEAVGMWYSFELPDGRIFSGNAGGHAAAVGGTKFINTSTSSDWIYS